MLMRDHPLAIDLAETQGRAHPNIGFLAVRPFSADPVEAVGEGHVIASSDA